jgi:hypothetical protein
MLQLWVLSYLRAQHVLYESAMHCTMISDCTDSYTGNTTTFPDHAVTGLAKPAHSLELYLSAA